MLENYKEVVEALEETNESVISHRVNDILRVLTAISVIVLPLTLIASIWGMNVGVPGEGDAEAFYAVVGGDGRAARRDAGLVPPPRLAVGAVARVRRKSRASAAIPALGLPTRPWLCYIAPFVADDDIHATDPATQPRRRPRTRPHGRSSRSSSASARPIFAGVFGSVAPASLLADDGDVPVAHAGAGAGRALGAGIAPAVAADPVYPVSARPWDSGEVDATSAPRRRQPHEGQDVFAKDGTRSSRITGVVRRGERRQRLSGAAELHRDLRRVDDRTYVYFHMQQPLAAARAPGVAATRSAPGCTGSCDDHLHFEIRLGRASSEGDRPAADARWETGASPASSPRRLGWPVANQRIWAPWRLAYVKDAAKDIEEECIFCAKPAQDDDEAEPHRPPRRALLRDPQPVPVHQRPPDGRPLRAHRDAARARAETVAEMMALAQRAMAVLDDEYSPARLQRRLQPGAGRGRRRRAPHPHARRARAGAATPTSCRCSPTRG